MSEELRSTPTVRWGIVGPGSIAHRFADQLPHSRTGVLTAVASRDRTRAESFAAEYAHGGADIRALGSYAELFADPQVDAVYIATVHTEHVRLAIEAARAGKHIVCEKPLAVNRPGVFAAIDAARKAGVYLAEGYMYRFHPQTARLIQLLREGVIGEVQHVEASFSFSARLPADHRLMNPQLAGGSILDVGGYPVSAARLIAGAALGEPFADPVSFSARGSIGETGVDEWATASMVFAPGITAHVTCGIAFETDNRIVVNGSDGRIVVWQPWLPSPTDGSSIEIARVGDAVTSVDIPGAYQYALQADALADNRQAGQSPQMNWADSLGNARVLDQWRRSIGLRYPFE